MTTIHPTGSASYTGILATQQGAQALVCALLLRLNAITGKPVVLTAEEIKNVAGLIFMESSGQQYSGYPDGERLAVWVDPGFTQAAQTGAKLQ